jgi:ankyrin repeat protein
MWTRGDSTPAAKQGGRCQNDRTALHWAAECGHEEVVRLVLEKGADVNVKDAFGSTALSGAAERGHAAIVQLLLEKADINAKDVCGQTALFQAVIEEHKEVVQLLLGKGADIHEMDANGRTVLDPIFHSEHMPLLKLILENEVQRVRQKEAEIEVKTSGRTALSQAAAGRHDAMAQPIQEPPRRP